MSAHLHGCYTQNAHISGLPSSFFLFIERNSLTEPIICTEIQKWRGKRMPTRGQFGRDMLSLADLRATLYEKQERWASHAGKTSIHTVRPCAQERSSRAARPNDCRRRTSLRRHRRFTALFVAHLHIHWFILFRYRAAAARPSAVTRSVHEIAPLRAPPPVVTSSLI